MSRCYGFAVLGNGYMARRHVAALEQNVRADVKLVVNRLSVVSGGSAAPGRFDSQTHLCDYLRRHEELDAVVICTPDHTHADYVEALVGAGKLLFCEKPLARTELEFERLRGVPSHGDELLVGMNCRFRSRVQYLKQLMATGALAGVNLVNASYYSSIFPILEGDLKTWWREFPEGTLPFLHGGAIHLFDALRFVLGDVAALSCVGASRSISAPLGGDTFVVAVKFRSGAVANVTITGTSVAPNRFEIWIDAEGCSVADGYMHKRAATGEITRTPIPEEDFGDVGRQWDHVIAVLDGSAAPLNTIDEAYKNFRVLRACELSAASGSWITVDGEGE